MQQMNCMVSLVIKAIPLTLESFHLLSSSNDFTFYGWSLTSYRDSSLLKSSFVHIACRYNRGWFYHKEHRLWFMRVPNVEPLVKTNSYERGSYICFDPNTWETIRKV